MKKRFKAEELPLVLFDRLADCSKLYWWYAETLGRKQSGRVSLTICSVVFKSRILCCLHQTKDLFCINGLCYPGMIVPGTEMNLLKVLRWKNEKTDTYLC